MINAERLVRDLRAAAVDAECGEMLPDEADFALVPGGVTNDVMLRGMALGWNILAAAIEDGEYDMRFVVQWR